MPEDLPMWVSHLISIDIIRDIQEPIEATGTHVMVEIVKENLGADIHGKMIDNSSGRLCMLVFEKKK